MPHPLSQYHITEQQFHYKVAPNSNIRYLHLHLTSPWPIRFLGTHYYHMSHITTAPRYPWCFFESCRTVQRNHTQVKWQILGGFTHSITSPNITNIPLAIVYGKVQIPHHFQREISAQLTKVVSRITLQLRQITPQNQIITTVILHQFYHLHYIFRPKTFTIAYTWCQAASNQKWTDKTKNGLHNLLIILWCSPSNWIHHSRSDDGPNILCIPIRQGHHVLQWSH